MKHLKYWEIAKKLLPRLFLINEAVYIFNSTKTI